MLSELHIQNLVLIKRAELSLHPKMITISGETGAGKSMILKAIGLLLGDRAKTGLVKSGEDKTDVQAVFDLIPGSDTQALIKSLDLVDSDNENSLIIRRVIHANGQSKAYINQRPTPLQTIRDISQSLLRLYSQHHAVEIQSQTTQTRELDGFGNHQTLLSATKHQAAVVLEADRSHSLLQQRFESLQQADALRRYQLEELDEFEPEQDEFENLSEQCKSFDQFDALKSTLANTHYALTASTLTTSIKQCETLISNEPNSKAKDNLIKLISETDIILQETSSALSEYADNLVVDPAAQKSMTERVERYHDLARKHQVHPAELYDHWKKLHAEQAHFAQIQDELDEIEASVEKALAAYQVAAQKLTDARIKAAKKLGQSVNKKLKLLDMKNAELRIDILEKEKHTPSALGKDNVQFMIRTNPGQDFSKLSDIASGGELSRIALAISVSLADQQPVGTIVFDEIDVGFSGQTAAKIGEQLQQLGQYCQVIAITHQAQVAAFADQHILVSKTQLERETLSHAEEIDEIKRNAELTRLISGKTPSEQTKKLAQEMRNDAKRKEAALA